MSLNPHNQPLAVAVNLRAVNLVASGIITVTSPLRFPRYAEASFSQTARNLIGGSVDTGVPAGAGGTSGQPYSVVVIQVSGIQADVQFWGGYLSGGVSGVVTPPSPAVSGAGYSGGTLTVRFWGDGIAAALGPFAALVHRND